MSSQSSVNFDVTLAEEMAVQAEKECFGSTTTTPTVRKAMPSGKRRRISVTPGKTVDFPRSTEFPQRGPLLRESPLTTAAALQAVAQPPAAAAKEEEGDNPYVSKRRGSTRTSHAGPTTTTTATTTTTTMSGVRSTVGIVGVVRGAATDDGSTDSDNDAADSDDDGSACASGMTASANTILPTCQLWLERILTGHLLPILSRLR